MEFDPNPTVQEILDELNKTPEGKNQLELAALRVVVTKQQAYIVGTAKEAVVDDDTDD
jgi:hypothetical protein